MSATDVQLSRMSEEVYKLAGGAAVSTDWKLVLDADRANLGDLKGYFGVAWYNNKTKELVFAHRGTEADSWQDWMADAGTIFSTGNPQISVARAFREAALVEAERQDYDVGQITHTGHSLGGNISQILAALRPDERALTFNPLGSGQLLQQYNLDPNGTYANIRNVRSWFDPAAIAGSIGQTFHMPVSTYPIIPDAVESVASVLFGAMAFKFVGPAGLVGLQLHFRTSQHSIEKLREVIEAAGGIVDTPLPAPQNQWQDLQGTLESNPALQLAATAPEYMLQPHLKREEIRFEIGAESETETGTDAADFMAGADAADSLLGAEGTDFLYGGLGNDSLDGGTSDDVLFGGGGADNLFGDVESSAIPFDWTITRVVDPQPAITYYRVAYGAGISVAEDAAGGADSLYGGAGEDWIFAGNGDDYVDGGAQGDVAFGEQGEDELRGDALRCAQTRSRRERIPRGPLEDNRTAIDTGTLLLVRRPPALEYRLQCGCSQLAVSTTRCVSGTPPVSSIASAEGLSEQEDHAFRRAGSRPAR